jgi:hypothetical protein
MILDIASAGSSESFDLFDRLLSECAESRPLLDSIWPWSNLQTSASVLKEACGRMAPDMEGRFSHLPYHPHRRYDPSNNYSSFEPQESRKCNPSLKFRSIAAASKIYHSLNRQERSKSCLPLSVEHSREDFLPDPAEPRA